MDVCTHRPQQTLPAPRAILGWFSTLKCTHHRLQKCFKTHKQQSLLTHFLNFVDLWFDLDLQMVYHLFHIFFPSIVSQICVGFSYLNGMHWDGYFCFKSHYWVITFFNEVLGYSWCHRVHTVFENSLSFESLCQYRESHQGSFSNPSSIYWFWRSWRFWWLLWGLYEVDL